MDFGSVLLSLFGFSVFSTGIVMTKIGGDWLKWTGPKNRVYFKSLVIWVLGFIVYNAAVIPNAMASQNLPPHIVSAILGWGIPFIVLLSALLLKEKLFASDFIFSLTMLAAIIVLSLLDKSATAMQLNQTAFIVLLVLPLLLLLPLPFKALAAKPRTILLALFAGCGGGLSLVIMNVVVKSLGYDIFSYFNTPYPYLYLACGVAQFLALQLAMRWGQMILIGPLQNALMILYPVFCSYFIFGASLDLLQLLMIVIIVISCVAILRKH